MKERGLYTLNRILKGKISESDKYVIFKKKMTKNLPKLIKDMNPKLKEKSLSKVAKEWDLENHHLATIITIDSGKKSSVNAKTSG